MRARAYMQMLPAQIIPCPLYVNYRSHPIWLGKEDMRGNLCHASHAVTRQSTEEDLRDTNEKRRQHWRRLQDNVLNRNGRALGANWMTKAGMRRGTQKAELRDADMEGWRIIFQADVLFPQVVHCLFIMITLAD